MDQPFRFLDLPKEIRLMVYERLPCQIKHCKLKLAEPVDFPKAKQPGASDDAWIILVVRSVSMAILVSSKLIYTEANTIVQNLATQFVQDAPPRIICSPFIRPSLMIDARSLHSLLDVWNSMGTRYATEIDYVVEGFPARFSGLSKPISQFCHQSRLQLDRDRDCEMVFDFHPGNIYPPVEDFGWAMHRDHLQSDVRSGSSRGRFFRCKVLGFLPYSDVREGLHKHRVPEWADPDVGEWHPMSQQLWDEWLE